MSPNGTDTGVNIRRVDPNPGVLISDNYYKARQGGLSVQGNKVRGRHQDKLKCDGRKQN